MTNSRPSISIVIPGLNEAGNIGKAVEVIIGALGKVGIEDYELLLIDDGSTDGTDKIIDDLSNGNEKLRSFHNHRPMGIGYNFRMGVSLAVKEYVGWFAGDNETAPEAVAVILGSIGKADAILPYTANPWMRPLYRRFLSTAYTVIFNLLFGLHLKYFNGACFFRREALKSIVMSTDSPAFMAEIVVQVIKNGASYKEVPMLIQEYGGSSVLKWKNVYMIGKTVLSLWPRIYLRKK